MSLFDVVSTSFVLGFQQSVNTHIAVAISNCQLYKVHDIRPRSGGGWWVGWGASQNAEATPSIHTLTYDLLAIPAKKQSTGVGR
jgi:hypothetical protein